MKLKIGTRGSRLALAQTDMAVREIKKHFPEIYTETVKISTRGDKIANAPLSRIGGKGVFVSEIERALLDGEIDIAVHSAKDLPVKLAEGTCIGAVLMRGNPHDALVMPKGAAINKDGRFVIGTGSQRRRIALSEIYPYAVFSDIRGNIDTRLSKLLAGEYDGIVLAAAGLERLGMEKNDKLEIHEIPICDAAPAPCQGIIAIQARSGEFSEILGKINHTNTFVCLETERAVLRLLNAGCAMPVGAYSQIEDGIIRLTATKDSIKKITDEAPAAENLALAERVVNRL
ncbi:MAG: hydroxymethylbilane synthase [Ruminococcus sp.]|nr:hydroxymethylbilane synthase [Ruminococcus sp.]